MKILLFGATGGTGKLVLDEALQNGHTVTAFVRNPAKLQTAHSHLTVVTGDVLQKESIDRCISGHDAVICCLGAPAAKAGTLRSQGTKNIIESMEEAGISRFICQTSLGYGDSEIVLKATPFVFRKLIAPLLLKKTFADHLFQEQFIKSSKLEWTIVRPGTLTNGKPTGQVKHDFDYADPSLKVKVSRADVAMFMVSLLKNPASIKQVTGVSY